MCSGEGTRALPRVGFPIRTSPDQSLISSSPRLIAAVHVLHRLQVPRHPPCALHLLIQIENTTNRYGVFKVRAEERFRRPGKTATAPKGRQVPVSQNSTVQVSVSTYSRRAPRSGRHCCHHDRGARGGLVPPHSLEKRGSNRSFRYGYLVTTSPQSPTPPSAAASQRVGARTSGVSGFRGVTGGVYKARERIHRDVADSRLLATPTSWRRVSASNPNWDRLFGIRSTSRFCSPLYRPL